MLHEQYKVLPPGTVLREWRLEEVLASDRPGIIYAARGLYFDEPVAIKAMRPGEGSVDASIDRTSVVSGKSVSVRVDLGGRRIIINTINIELDAETLRLSAKHRPELPALPSRPQPLPTHPHTAPGPPPPPN